MKNIFVVGSEVKDESQIGYKRYIEKFTDILMNTSNNISITGLKRFGKTSLAKEVLRQVKEKSKSEIVVIFIDLAKQKSFSDLLLSINNFLQDEFWERDVKDILENKLYIRYIEKVENINPESKTYRDTIESIFKLITRLGYRIILAIDEFDAASDLFKDTADFEFLRDLSTNRDIGVSLLLISRRQLYMIEKKNFNNSTFHGIVQTFPIDGFNEDDFALFYQTLKENYNIDLSDNVKVKLKHYCGNSPYLISMFAFDIVDKFLENKPFNIDDIYERRGIDVENYYKSIFACLNNDKITVEGALEEVSTIEKLIGIIIGPKIGIVEGDFRLLKNMGYLYPIGEKYISISNHFTNALRNYPFSVDTWKAILGLEKLLKSMIRNQIMINKRVNYISYDIWEEVFEKIGAVNSLSLYDSFVEDSMKEYKHDVDILDVCSLDLVVTIIQFYWRDYFDQFFNNDEWKKWESKFRDCAKARDPMAHGHEEFLTVESRAYVNEYCKEIINLLKNSNACIDIETGKQIEINNKIAQLKREYWANNYSTIEDSLKGGIYYFTAAVQDFKGIKGYIKVNEKLFKCSIGKNKWERKFATTKLGHFIGKEFEVIIIGVNVPQNSISVEFT